MKVYVISLGLLIALETIASAAGIICRDDQRMSNGSLRELILSEKEGGYLLQSHYVPSLQSSDIEIKNLAQKLVCRIDEKSILTFCEDQKENNVQIKERREVFFDSLEEDAKKRSEKYIDISVYENGVEKKSISFAASHCQTFGKEA